MQPPPPEPTQDRALTHRSLLVVGVFASIVILLVLAWYLVDVLLLVFAGALLAILVRAPADWLASRTRLPVNGALALVLVGGVALLGVGGWLFGHTMAEQMAQLVREIPRFVDEAAKRVEQYDWIIQRIRPRELIGEGSNFLGKGFRVLSTTFGAIAGFVIALFMGIFFAIQPDLYVRGFVDLFSKPKRQRIEEVLYAVGSILHWWLLGQLTLMLAVGLMSGIGLWMLGVPLALALGVLSGLLNFVPYLGPIFAAVPAVLVALAEDPLLAGYVVLLYAGVQSIEGYVLEPIVQQKAVYLPPALILFAQIVLGILIGIPGVMLATPLAAALMVTVKMLYIEDVLGAKQKAG